MQHKKYINSTSSRCYIQQRCPRSVPKAACNTHHFLLPWLHLVGSCELFKMNRQGCSSKQCMEGAVNDIQTELTAGSSGSAATTEGNSTHRYRQDSNSRGCTVCWGLYKSVLQQHTGQTRVQSPSFTYRLVLHRDYQYQRILRTLSLALWWHQRCTGWNLRAMDGMYVRGCHACIM